MSATPFKVGGALTDEHAAIYIERQADRDALTHLQAMDYLLIIEPRQQGKTSLINHLMRHPALGYVAFAYLDVTTPNRSTEATWYQTLCPRILRQLRSFIPRDQWPAIPQNSANWRDFLWDVSALATDAHQRVVIALDEVGAVTFPGATAFFSVLRDVYNSRQAETEFKQLTFLLSGAFHPRNLIQDDKISPFNIAQRVRLPDFTLAQMRELVGKGEWTDEQATTLAERIHYWTDGQPYLAQLLCSYLGPGAIPADVDAGVDRLRREDENHLPPILKRLNSDEKLCRYAERILAGERIKFYPRENRRQARLELLGVIKADTNGCCRVRNRVYEEILVPGESLKIEIESSPPPSELPTIWKRLIVTNQTGTEVTNCEAHLLSIEHLDRVTDSDGEQLLSSEPYWLSWVPGQFERISISSGQSKELDLVWWRHSPRGEPESCLRAASSSHLGTTRQSGETDLVELHNSGWYLIRIAIEAADLEPIEKEYLLFWNGPQGDSLHVEERQLSRQSRPLVMRGLGPKAPNSYPDLVDALTHRILTLFIGTDLPCEVTGLPSRADLARHLARRKGLDESLSLAEVAQRVSQAGNRWEFTDFIRNAVDTAGRPPQSFHRGVVELVKTHQIETLITTAYDNLLELAFQDAGVGTNRVVRGSDADFIRPDRLTLIKLYGDAQQPDTLVVTDRDHSSLLRDRDKEAMVDEVRRTFRRNTVLFLGYNLADPDFRFLFDQIVESRFARTAYAVWPDLPGADVRMWRDRGIVILDTDPFGILDKAVVQLALKDRPEPEVSTPISPEPVRGDDIVRETVPTSPQPEPDERRHLLIRVKLQLARLVGLDFEARVFESPVGEARAATHLPYNPGELIAVLKALPAGSLDGARLTSSQTDALRHLGLLINPDLVPDLHIQVGRALYKTLFPGDVGEALRMALNQARTQRGAVALQLRFDEDAVVLARCPWELLYHRRHLLPSGAVELTRYISYPEPPTALPVEPPLRVLYVESRPTDLAPLPIGSEQAVIRSALESLARDGRLVLERLSLPTYDALLDHIESAQDHILHFDGHGTVARRCPACNAMNYPHHTNCQRSGCGHSLEGVPPLGYLAFEHNDESREVDWVDSRALEHILFNSAVRVAVLSACRGSEARGETLFGGTGPALIQAGVSAVVAMQVPITVPATVKFMQGFYGALARFESLPAAMTSGRRRLFRSQEWFIPTLYLRSQDDEGRLFAE
jgi:hypothetical protein